MGVALLWCPWEGMGEGESRRGTGLCEELLRLWGMGLPSVVWYTTLGRLGQVHGGPRVTA